jgi:hypothetical protein
LGASRLNLISGVITATKIAPTTFDTHCNQAIKQILVEAAGINLNLGGNKAVTDREINSFLDSFRRQINAPKYLGVLYLEGR